MTILNTTKRISTQRCKSIHDKTLLMAGFALFAALGLPGLSGFVGEALVFMGAFPVYRTLTIIAALGIVIGAAYVLWMLQRVFLGPQNDKWKDLPDINTREMFTLVPLGIYMALASVLE